MTESIDLAAYLARINYTGPVEPSLPVLHCLVQQHVAAIPFENLDVLAGRVPNLTLPALQEKMLHSRRGGYCLEQNTLLSAALTGVGYKVEGMIARVRLGVPEAVSMQRTHMMLMVLLAEKRFLVDVGFGAMVPTAPLRLDDETPVETSNGRFRIQANGAHRMLQSWMDEDWRNLYYIEPHLPEPADYDMANFFVATVPNGMFTANLILSRVVEGERRTVLNSQFTRRQPGKHPVRHSITSREAFAAFLRDEFDLITGDAELDAISRVVDASLVEQSIAVPF